MTHDEHLEGRIRQAMHELADRARTTPAQALDHDQHRSSSIRPRVFSIAAAMVLIAAGVVAVAALRSGPDPTTDGGPPATNPLRDRNWFVDLQPDTVAPLPPAPIEGRFGPAAVWTGDEMVVWAGATQGSEGEMPLGDGAAFDPFTGTWRPLPAAPIEGRAYASTVWTGEEMVVWGGSSSGQLLGDGAAYDPSTDSWRVLSPSPVEPSMKAATVWTGSEMIVIGGLNKADVTAAAYDPTNDTWRRLPDAPGTTVTPPYPHAAWTGEAVLTTVYLDASQERIGLVMYRPETDTWETVQDDFPSQFLVGIPGVEAGMVGDETIALTTRPDQGMPVLSVFGDIGNELAPKPEGLADINTWAPVWSGHEILLWAGGDTGLAFDPIGPEWMGRWREFPAGGLTPRVDGAIVWADGVLLAWGGFPTGPSTATPAADDGIVYRPVDPPSSDERIATPPTDTSPIDTRDGCPTDHPGDWKPGPDGITDWADFVQVGGRSYDRQSPTALDPGDLGEVVGRVCFTLGDMTFSGEAPIQDGDASFLPVGTELRAIPGSDPGLRLAAVASGEVLLYEAVWIEEAEVGADLIDVDGDFLEIGINSQEDGSRITSITNSAAVAELVDLLATAPADLSPRPESERNGRRYFIELVRADGTSTTRAFWIDTGELWPGIDLPTAWRDAVQQALDRHAASDLGAELDPAGGLDGPLMYWRQTDGEVRAEGAEIVGLLFRDGDCLSLFDEENLYPLLWPYGTRWDASQQAVRLPDGRLLRSGDRIDAGGGYHAADHLGGFTLAPDVIARADECATNEWREVAVVQSYAE